MKIFAGTDVLLRAILPDDGQRGAALAGGDTFVSFDKEAVRLVQASGHAARLLA